MPTYRRWSRREAAFFLLAIASFGGVLISGSVLWWTQLVQAVARSGVGLGDVVRGALYLPFFLGGAVLLAIAARHAREPIELRVDDGALVVVGVFRTRRIAASAIRSIDLEGRWLWLGEGDGAADEHQLDRLALVLRHEGGVLRLARSGDLPAFAEALAARYPTIRVGERVRTLLTP